MYLSYLGISDELGSDDRFAPEREQVNHLIIYPSKSSEIYENFLLGPYERIEKYTNDYTDEYEKNFKKGLEVFNNQGNNNYYFTFSSNYFDVSNIKDGYISIKNIKYKRMDTFPLYRPLEEFSIYTIKIGNKESYYIKEKKVLCICYIDINLYPFDIVKIIKTWIDDGEKKEKMPFYIFEIKKMRLHFIENFISIKGRKLSVIYF